jgi:heavy metal efflux system protein
MSSKASKGESTTFTPKNLLPNGLRIVPFYDRIELITAALNTVYKSLAEGVALVVVVLFLFLGNLRSALIVVGTLVLAPLATFIVMGQIGLTANLMSLGGLAIAIGMIVDGSVVVVENVYRHLSHRSAAAIPTASARHAIGDGSRTAGRLRDSDHYLGVFPSLVASGDGRQDVQAAGLYHHDRAAGVSRFIADAVAGTVLVGAQTGERGGSVDRPRHAKAASMPRPCDGRSDTGSVVLGLAVGALIGALALVPSLGS